MAQLNGAPATPADLQALALTNYGHFTSIRVDEGRARGLSLHLERLVRDCRTVFGAELDSGHVLNLAARAALGMTGSFVIRVTVFDPEINLGNPGANATPHILVTTRPVATAVQPPLRVQARTFLRELPAVKHTGLFAALHHRRAAQLDGFDDALFTDTEGTISEGGTWNIGFIDAHGHVVWPKADVLPGVTMTLLRRAHEHAIAPVTLELTDIQAAFATNASIGVRPIAAIDDRELVAEHPVIATLHRAYAADPGEPLE